MVKNCGYFACFGSRSVDPSFVCGCTNGIPMVNAGLSVVSVSANFFFVLALVCWCCVLYVP